MGCAAYIPELFSPPSPPPPVTTIYYVVWCAESKIASSWNNSGTGANGQLETCPLSVSGITRLRPSLPDRAVIIMLYEDEAARGT